MYRLVALARAVDERMWILNRAGRIPFVISGQGHEGAQVGDRLGVRKGHDWIAPFYRSIATCLTFGMSARDILTAQYATASRPLVGRPPDARPLRLARAQPRVGLVAGRDAAPARGRDRAGRQDPQDRPGRDDEHGRGLLEPGRRPRGAELRGDPQAAVHLRRREQRLCDQRAGGDGRWPVERRGARRRLRHARRHRRRCGRAGVLRGCQGGGRAGAGGRRPDADRGEGHAADRRTRRTTSRRSTGPRRSSSGSASDACRASASSCARPAC